MQNSNTHSFSNILEYVKTELNEFDKNTEWLDTSICSNFLTSGSINIVSAGSGVGKTYFIVSFAIFLLKNKIINRVIHLNFDGNTDIFTARKQSQDIKNFYALNQWFHIRAEDLMGKGISLTQFIKKQIETKADLKKTLFIYDSFVNFVPKLNDTDEVSKFMSLLRMCSNLGAIHWINTHNKKGEDIYSGSSMILNLSDATWMLKSTKNKDKFVFLFKNIKGRHLYKNQAFELLFDDNTIIGLDYDEASRTNLQNELIDAICELLHKNPLGLTQTKILQSIGRSRFDKTARNILLQNSGKLWEIQTRGREKIVTIL